MSERTWFGIGSGLTGPATWLVLAALLAPQGAERLDAQERTPIQIGEARVGTLGPDDPTGTDGVRYDEYVLRLDRTRTVQVDLTSADFDTYIRLYSLSDPANQIAYDDDGGEGFDSRLVQRLSAGTYLVRATGYSTGASGAYRIAISESRDVDPVPSTMSVGEVRRGTLDSGDARTGDSHYEDWIVRANAGTPLRIDLTSDDFDTYLYVGRGAGSGFQELNRNDDGGEGLNSGLVFVPPSSGEYVVRASSYGSGVTGSYELSVMRQISPGETLAGRLESSDPVADGKYFDDYVFEAQAGVPYHIDMRADGVDGYLHVGRGTGASFESLASNDDGGEGLNPSMTFIPSASGWHVIRATSYWDESTGSYRLSVERGSNEVSQRRMYAPTVEDRLEQGDALASGGGFFDEWTFEGRAGQRVSVSLRSDDFDPVVELGTASGARFRQLARDDDGGGDLNSYLEYTLPHTGTFTIRVRSFAGAGGGAYQLELR